MKDASEMLDTMIMSCRARPVAVKYNVKTAEEGREGGIYCGTGKFY